MAGSFALAAIMTILASPAWCETINIYAAGSLTKVVETLAKDMAPKGVQIVSTFGPSGRLRARIEGGETPDLFLSADMAAPRKLDAEGRTVTPPIMFAQNRMCLVARRSLDVTAENLVDRLLEINTRLKTSTPVEDPSGDYAAAIVDRIDAMRPGTGRILRAKMQASAGAARAATPLEGRSAAGSLFLTDQIDLLITYCSSGSALQQEAPELIVIPFPTELDPHPLNGLAILSAKLGAARVALYLLSDRGQAIVRSAGLIPVWTPPRQHP